MNRRKAIFRISWIGLGTVAGAGGYSWYSIGKTPDLAFASNNRELIAALAETIIPSTDTPGARQAAVHDHILRMLGNCMERKEQNTFIDGLKDVQAYCSSKYDQGYEHCTTGQQERAMAYFEKKSRSMHGLAGKVRLRIMGRPFFTLLKDHTVEGYCTSEAGATKGLTYSYIPGSFSGCMPLQPGQKSWATN